MRAEPAQDLPKIVPVAVSAPVISVPAVSAVESASSVSANMVTETSPLTQQVSQAPGNGSAELIESTRQEARTCMQQQNYDCAEANLKTILRLSPNDSESVTALQEIKQIRTNAFKGDWNAK